MGNTLQKAKKRVEDRFNKFVLKKGKKKDGSMEETQGSCKFSLSSTRIVSCRFFFLDFSRKNSLELGETSRENEFVVLKERRLVATLPVFNGMLRFSFMLETCQPGSVPDPHLLAAVLDLVLSLDNFTCVFPSQYSYLYVAAYCSRGQSCLDLRMFLLRSLL